MEVLHPLLPYNLPTSQCSPMANSTKSKRDLNCKKHPKHRQSPGVCSICLTQKLARLSSRKPKIADSMDSYSSSSSLSSYCSSSCSSCSSPNRDLFESRSSLFKKSRSMAFGDTNGKKSGGFWSRFLRRGKRIDEALTHSRTMVQRVHG